MAISVSVQSAWRDTFDRSTYALNTIDYAHHEIHSGSFYSAGTITDLASGGTVQIMMTTPNTTKWLHLLGLVEVESESLVKWYENPTSPSAGAALPAMNHNRNSSNVAGGSVAGTVGVFSGTPGDLLFQYAMGSGRGVGGEIREINEWVLKQNEQYILEVVNNASGASWTAISFAWYEHTDKE
jgi:hypothetical protein